MAKKLLIDASHAEEVRIAVVNNGTLEEFDSESVHKKHLKSNIYLAKVVRIEPSLQAAFVEYGGNRHGFLPFGEIHPDYFQIPVSDREEILAQGDFAPTSPLAVDIDMEAISGDLSEDDVAQNATESDTENEATDAEDDTAEDAEDAPTSGGRSPRNSRNKAPHFKYKIQEVLKRRQILLIQVVKEERGNKGAALTTYLSLAGRYCVLMPNAGRRSGGISRKIDDGDDRKRLKEIIGSLEIPEGMSLIVRTAGQSRNKTEIKKDYEYLLKLWAEIRELTLKSIAPCLIHEEGDLVKRAIRDIYNRDIDEVLVEGDNAYKAAKNLMKQMMPSHAKKVQAYKETNLPMFHKYRIEEQIDTMMQPVATLPSGGYIVINPTEALVSIDVNSGRSTKERSIDDTAFKTNMEAAEEIARQLRLRDMAGLIVVDFIDMHENRHVQQVERKLKESLNTDRARIQVGRISQFGLLEMSRQRLRPSLVETHSVPCAHCNGTGHVRSVESLSLQVLRSIESEAIKGKAAEIVVTVPNGADLYLLNQKRSNITHLETRFNIRITIDRDMAMAATTFRLDVAVHRESAETDTVQVIEAQPRRVESKPRQDQERSERDQNRRPRQERQPRPENQRSEAHKVRKVDPVVEENADVEQAETAPLREGEQRRRKRNRNKGRRDKNISSTDQINQELTGSVDGNDVPVQVSSAESSEEGVATQDNTNKPRRNRRNRFRNRRDRNRERPEGQQNGESLNDAAPSDRGDQARANPKPKPAPTRTNDLKEPANANAGDQSGEDVPKKKRGRNWLRRLLDA